MITKFKEGDKVKIVKYGAPIWEHKNSGLNLPYPIIEENETTWWKDMLPQIVGRTGIIREATITQGISKYAIDGIPEKCSWYHDSQLELTE